MVAIFIDFLILVVSFFVYFSLMKKYTNDNFDIITEFMPVGAVWFVADIKQKNSRLSKNKKFLLEIFLSIVKFIFYLSLIGLIFFLIVFFKSNY